MSLLSIRLRGAAAWVLPVLFTLPLAAQQEVPAAPQETPAAAAPSFPKPDPANFTAVSPTKEQVAAFLEASWGYDTTRVWQVQAIVKTSVEGISKVVVLVGDKTGKQQTGALQFFALPDGKHIITGEEILPFGPNPYAENRAKLLERADGPYKGAAAKDLELVEFADFQCPHCKEAQATMDKLAADFPNARIVYESYPLVKIHSEAFKAAAYGVCIAKQAGNAAFFKFASAVYDGQAGLTPEGATLTLNSATSAAGLDPAKIQACSETPQTKAAVEASIKLAEDMGVSSTPTLAINGRMIPIGGVAYDTLKKIVTYDAAHSEPLK